MRHKNMKKSLSAVLAAVMSVSLMVPGFEQNAKADDSVVTRDLSAYNITGYAKADNVTGGGVIDESATNYIKVYTAEDLLRALNVKDPSTGKKWSESSYVIEVMNDIDLGYNMLSDDVKSLNDVKEHAKPKTHPTLKETGVSLVYIEKRNNVTLFSKNGAKIKHAGITVKGTSNLIIRNLEFDELWEWDDTGEYDSNDWDYLTISKECDGIWIDHCTFNKAYDGIVDVKDGAKNVTVSWSDFEDGDMTEGSFFDTMMDYLEDNASSFKNYNSALKAGFTQEDIRTYASAQKKTHLVGARSFDSKNADLSVTLADNYYHNSLDRIPRLRGGNAHIFNCVIDSSDIWNLKLSLANRNISVPSKIKIVSNGAISTEGGTILMENCNINGMNIPVRNNNTDPTDDKYTGYIAALNTRYTINNGHRSADGTDLEVDYDGTFIGNSTDVNSPLAPFPCADKSFDVDSFKSSLGYTPTLYDADSLNSTVMPYVGAGVLPLTTTQWMQVTYSDSEEVTTEYTEFESTIENTTEETSKESSSEESTEQTTEVASTTEEVTTKEVTTKETTSPDSPVTSDKTGTTTTLGTLKDEDIANKVYVSPNGTSDGKGTIASPLSLDAAVRNAVPGQVIILTDGTYSFDEQFTIDYENVGNSNAYKYLKAANGAKVVLDFSSQPYDSSDTSKNARGIQLDGSYWHLYGLTVYGAADNGIYVTGKHNIVENCILEANRDTGLQISRRNSTLSNKEDWPSDNLILNCTSFNNMDPATGENADGFAAKLTCGEGNVFDGCISYNNVDDGWDLYAKTATGAIGSVTIKNSIAFRNGATSEGVFTKDSDGNGFKLGGSKIAVSHLVSNCIAFENKNHGFTDNSNPGTISLKDCTSFNNSLENGKKSNFDFARSESSYNVFENLISFSNKKVSSDKYRGEATNCSFQNGGKYYLITDKSAVDTKTSGGYKGELNKTGVSATDFTSISSPAIGTDIHTLWRNSDGTVNTHGFLETSADSSYSSMGAHFGNSAATIINCNITLNGEETTTEETTTEETTSEEVTTEEVTTEEVTTEEVTTEEVTTEEVTTEEVTTEEVTTEEVTTEEITTEEVTTEETTTKDDSKDDSVSNIISEIVASIKHIIKLIGKLFGRR